MNRSTVFAATAAFLAAATLGPGIAAPTIVVSNAWSRPATDTGGIFLSIANSGAADRLVAAASTVAAHVELHESIKVTAPAMSGSSMSTPGAMGYGSAMTMRHVPAIAIAAGTTTVLKPGGYHVMLIGLKQPLTVGEKIPLRLTFAHAGSIETTATVRPM